MKDKLQTIADAKKWGVFFGWDPELISDLPALSMTFLDSGVSRMAYPRGANRGRGFGAPGQIEEWRPSAEVLDGEGARCLK